VNRTTESYQRRIDHLEAQNKQLLDQLMKCDLVTPRVYEMKCDKSLIDEAIIKENNQLKSDLQVLRERLKEIEFIDTFDPFSKRMRVCPCCGGKEMHKMGCWLKYEINNIDKLKGVE
jgi:hypothetical protein